MYFYNLEEDCQDRELEMNVEPIHMMDVEEWESWLIDNNVSMNVNVSILKRFNTSKTELEPSQLASESTCESVLINSRQNGASLAKVINMSNRVKEPVNSQQEAPNRPSSRDVLRALALQESKKNPLIKKIDRLFSEFVGMSHLKEEVYRQASFIKVQQMRKEKNIMVAASPSRHMVFKGGPGTGKTTVARVIADIYHELGVLDTSNVVETDRSGLIGEYLGQTAVKTKELIESAIGGVLFIDEAYSLTEQSNEYGGEAVDMLLKMMEDHRDDLVVIVAGYGDEMDRFVASNPGLQSRFNRYMDFPDYSEEELWEILLKLCKDNSYTIQDHSLLKPRLLQEFELQKKQQGKHFGNARYIRNLFERAIESQSYRLIQSSITDSVSLQSLKYCDFFSEDQFKF